MTPDDLPAVARVREGSVAIVAGAGSGMGATIPVDGGLMARNA